MSVATTRPEQTLKEQLARIEHLIGQIEKSNDLQCREAAREVVSDLLELHGEGLARLVGLIRESGPEGDGILARAAAEPALAGLLLLHGIHPQSLEERIGQALESVRPYMQSHGGDVELLGIRDGVVRLRLHGNCDGCQASFITMKLNVERAINEAAPEIAGLEVEGMPEQEPVHHPVAVNGNGME